MFASMPQAQDALFDGWRSTGASALGMRAREVGHLQRHDDNAVNLLLETLTRKP